MRDHVILKCRKCGHGLLEDHQDIHYDDDYFTSHYDAPPPGSREFLRKVREQTHRLKRRVLPCARRGRLLDVGCGLGHFLYAAQQYGFDVAGYDFVDTNRDYISGQLGIQLQTSSDTAESSPGDLFDVVTSWHSIEHSEDPRGYLEFVRTRMDPSGVFIVEAPTHDSIDAFVEAEQWDGWDPPFHIQHFTLTSLRRLLEQSGFRVIDEHTYNCQHVRRVLEESRFSLLARRISMLFRGGSAALTCRLG